MDQWSAGRSVGVPERGGVAVRRGWLAPPSRAGDAGTLKPETDLDVRQREGCPLPCVSQMSAIDEVGVVRRARLEMASRLTRRIARVHRCPRTCSPCFPVSSAPDPFSAAPQDSSPLRPPQHLANRDDVTRRRSADLDREPRILQFNPSQRDVLAHIVSLSFIGRATPSLPDALDPDYLVSDRTDGEHFVPLIQCHAEQGPPREAIFLIFDSMLALLPTVAGHGKPRFRHEPLHLGNRS